MFLGVVLHPCFMFFHETYEELTMDDPLSFGQNQKNN